jgi:hypothetical protein
MQFLKILPNVWGRLNNKMMAYEKSPFFRIEIKGNVFTKGFL